MIITRRFACSGPAVGPLCSTHRENIVTCGGFAEAVFFEVDLATSMHSMLAKAVLALAVSLAIIPAVEACTAPKELEAKFQPPPMPIFMLNSEPGSAITNSTIARLRLIKTV